MNNPLFNNARGSASSLQMVPPFAFQGMTTTVFPVRANLSQLRRFCDQYLNQDSDLVRFEPFIPYVYLMLLDYGKMSVEAANMGWVSQCEVAFSVPLRWMVKKDGVWEFHDWAINCPFIFVDNELSMTTGREVYGWPKVLARIDPSVSDWVSDPHGPRKVFEVQTSAIGQAYQDEEAKYGSFLSVYHKSIPNFMDTPSNLSGLLDPLTRMPNMALNFAQLSLDLCKTFSGIAMQGITGSSVFPNLLDPNFYKKQFRSQKAASWADPDAWEGGLRDLLWSLFPRMYTNTVNLKQFRDSSSPWEACYQAVTNSKMEHKSINGYGPLGQQNLLLGQIDGGYRIDIHRYANQPIVDALGLQVDASHMDGNVSVSTLRPVFPFWLKTDMNYSRGKTITWRSRASAWHHGEGLNEILAPENQDTRAADADRLVPEDQETKAADKKALASKKTAKTEAILAGNPYNTARGAAIQGLSGPFELPNTTIRVLPLIADKTTLEKFVRDYLTVDQQARFEAWGSHVYLVAYNFTQQSSDANDIGLFAAREVNFAVPVKQYHWYDEDEYDLSTPEGREKRDAEKFATAALVTPFAYVDDAIVAITSSEVNGVPTLRSDVGSPAHTWMDTSGPEAGQNLLKTSALVIPALGVDAGAEHAAFLQVNTDKIIPLSDEAGWRHIAHNWGPVLTEDLRRKYYERGIRHEQSSDSSSFRRLRALALEALAGKININSVTLKQFRDAWETDKACYQAVVQGRKKINRLYEIHEIQSLLNVRITKYPTQPVSEILGLKPKYAYPGSDVEVFEAIRPFWLRADITEELGQTLFERVADIQWVSQQQPDQLAGWQDVTALELKSLRSDKLARVSYLERMQGSWIRQTRSLADNVEDLETADIDAIISLQTHGMLRDLKLSSRDQERSIMDHRGTLNHIDRVHVPDLSAFLDARQGDELGKTSSEELGEDFGRVSPATIIDSIISRQWGRPETHRNKNHKADYGVNVNTVGLLFGKQLFPQSERRENFWPQSGDDQAESENHRKGLAWQLWDDVWMIVRSGDDTGMYEQNKKPDDPDTYYAKAKDCLPVWFLAGKAPKPGDWSAVEWQQIADGLKILNDWSHGKVDWNRVIRKLVEWQKVASTMQLQLSIKPKPDAAGKFFIQEGGRKVAPNVAEVLAQRLKDLAEK